ncbi:MAG TPA: glycoside hydrolase family 15 protein [Vicinamibacterales bacterium]
MEDYALIGDGRSAALVALDGSIDWLCLPNFDSGSVFGGLLDVERGGTFALKPTVPFRSSRRYVPQTNVLETTFDTDAGTVRLIDAMTLPDGQMPPMRELVREVTGVSGRVPLEWRAEPRFAYSTGVSRPEWRGIVPVATHGSEAVAFPSWDAGAPSWKDCAVGARFELEAGARALVSMTYAHGEPLVMPGRSALEQRLADTVEFWTRWTRSRSYEGPWAEQVLRSALVLKALIFAPSGASVAAPTTSLPEEIKGERNWDYRFCWIRDSNFATAALLNLRCYDEAESLFWWFMNATSLTKPRLHVLYDLDGGPSSVEHTLPLSGYRKSRPVRVGNSAVGQTQHDIYGCLFETARLCSEGHRPLDPDIGEAFAEIADEVCAIWRKPDSGIWEVRNGPFHFTHSKVMCWVSLDRAVQLAERGEMPTRHIDDWRREAEAIRTYVDSECWSPRLRSYTRIANEDDVDASLLMLLFVGFDDPKSERLNRTIDAIQERLRRGDFVYRYLADDGVHGGEGCFMNCSFWLVGALARAGRVDEASTLMNALVARANDVGLYSEEVDPGTGAFLGNFPQALVHLALIDAAISIQKATTGVGRQ